MKLTENELRALHAEACAAVLKTDRSLSPVEDAFWPLYIQTLVSSAVKYGQILPCECTTDCGDDGNGRHC